jgi:hypothetical protein
MLVRICGHICIQSKPLIKIGRQEDTTFVTGFFKIHETSVIDGLDFIS